LEETSPQRRSAPGTRPNLLLASLPEAESQRLAPFLDTVTLDLKDVMVEAGEPIRYVYFPCGSVASSVYTMRDGSTVETAITGLEGVVGVHVWLQQSVAVTRTFIQVPGECMRMRSDVFLAEVVHAKSPLNDLIAQYVSGYLSLTSITAACNRIHRIEERLCRWLKMVHNRVEGDIFPVRHEFLAYMLGVHRPSVSIAAAMLRKAGLIDYEYGRLTVLDAKGLEAGACECYAAMELEFERRFGHRIRK
jgi:CRP-like cAMP-binding protein